MKPDRVIVFKTPVDWETFVRHHQVEPEDSERHDAVPYFLERDNSQRFDEEDRKAIQDLHPRPETLLVRQEGSRGTKFVPIGGECIELLSELAIENAEIAKNEICKTINKIGQFLGYLGGQNVKVHKTASRDKEVIDQTKAQSNVNVSMCEEASGGLTVNGDNQKKTQHSSKIEAAVIIERCDSNWRKAQTMLDADPWLKNHFQILYRQVQEGEIHGQYHEKLSISIFAEMIAKYKAAIEIAGKYKFVTGKVKMEVGKSLRSKECLTEFLEYSMYIPDNCYSA